VDKTWFSTERRTISSLTDIYLAKKTSSLKVNFLSIEFSSSLMTFWMLNLKAESFF